MRARIFLSYRRGDADAEARALRDHLRKRFKHVFFDRDSLRAGDDFPKAIRRRVIESDALVAVIGKGWVRSPADSSELKADDPSDWVRLEVATALALGIPTFPVLVGGAQIPSRDVLPRSLDGLAKHHASELSESRWDHDVGVLTDHIEEKVTAGTDPWWRQLAPALLLVVLIGLIIAAVAVVTLRDRPEPTTRLIQPALDGAGTLTVGRPQEVEIEVMNFPVEESVWLVVEADRRYQPDEPATRRPGNRWVSHVSAGSPDGIGPHYKLHVVRATNGASAEFQRHVDNARRIGKYEGLEKLPAGATTIGDPIPLIRR